MKSHTMETNLESLSWCFKGCEQTVTWLKSWQGGCRSVFFLWYLIVSEDEQLWPNYQPVILLFLLSDTLHFLNKTCFVTTFINIINLIWETGPELCISNFWPCVHMCLCMSMCVCMWMSVYGWGLKAPRAALDAALAAALAAAVWTVLLDITPVANSCWAFSKLAPVVRYSACT